MGKYEKSDVRTAKWTPRAIAEAREDTEDILVASKREYINSESLDGVHVHDSKVCFPSASLSAVPEFHSQTGVQIGVNYTENLECISHNEPRDQ